MKSLTTAGIVLAWCQLSLAVWYGHDYWNNRYTDEGISYPNERFYLWSAHSQVKENYFLDSSFYSTTFCTGCVSCGKELVGCSASVVKVHNQNVEKITEKSFSSGVKEIELINLAKLVEVEDKSFHSATNLQKLQIYGTSITVVPDISKTVMEEMYLVKNKIRFFPHNYTKQVLPTSLRKVSLIDNKIEWFPDEFVAKTNVEVLALSRNNIRQFPGTGLTQMPNLKFLSLDDNELKVVSREHLTKLHASPLQHLNMSNNLIWYIEPGALSQLTSLKILELHNNEFEEIPEGTFGNVPELIHLDLVKNKIKALTARSFTNLPKLVTIRLHSQDPPLNNIQYNAFQNIHTSLKHLWISDNELRSFPHPAMSADNYTVLLEVYADNNLIKDPTEYSTDDFPKSMTSTAKLQAAKFSPFTTMVNVKLLNFGSNQIINIQPDYFCNTKFLETLYLDDNGLTDARIPANAFSCMGQLINLYLQDNLLTYVPRAVMSLTLTKLQLLRLSSNKITHVETGTFTPLISLDSLYLENNNIIIVENSSFPTSIKVIVLQGNNFRFVNENPFSNLPSLQTLYLGYNSIVDIPDTAFQGCTSLVTLQLHQNKIGRIQKELFRDCPLTTELKLNNNVLRYVEDGALDHITSINHIHLHENRLTEIPNGGDFNNLQVQDLYLQDNRITQVRPGNFIQLTCTGKLDLSGNQIALLGNNSFEVITGEPDLTLSDNPLWTIESGAFKNVELRDLYLETLKIDHLKTATFDTVQARYIYLTQNSIDYMEEGVFAGTNTIDYFVMNSVGLKAVYGMIFSGPSVVNKALDLRSNQLEMLPPDIVANVQLHMLSVSSNRLTNFPRDIFLENKMTLMDISYNLIASLPDDAFDGLTNMISINLKGNQLTQVKNGSFNSLINVQMLDFSENRIVTWPKGLTDPMSSLKTLRLSDNLLYHFPAVKNGSILSSLDLSDNLLTSIENGAFDSLNATLTSIDLTNNAFECTCDLHRTLKEVYPVLKGGNCSEPNAAEGVLFGIENEINSKFFVNFDKEVFVCAPVDVTGEVTGNKLTVSWSMPEFLNSEEEKDKRPLPNDTKISYNVSCTGSLGDTLVSSVNQTTSAVFTVKSDSEYVCVVTLGAEGQVSAFSEPTTVHTSKTTVQPGNNTVVTVGLSLPVLHYDFSAVHQDFAGLSENIIGATTYIPSPYGAWLAISSHPSTDSFSDWYLPKGGVNVEINSSITLEKLSDSPLVYRYSAGSFFPVDDLGYGNEQKDCGGTTHNFGFTSVIRMGMIYQGTESIGAGGGDDMWLYINGQLITYISPRGTTSVVCRTFDLSQAAQTGGAKIIPREGTVSGSACVTTKNLPNQVVDLDLEVGERYHFELFHAERLLCGSSFFLELTDFQFITEVDEHPPVDYRITMYEDVHLDGILQTLILTDTFSGGPPFTINIIKGNEARHFEVKSDTTANQNAGIAPAKPALAFTTVAGISFLECSTPSSVPADTVDTSTETFSVSTQTALLTVAKPVDYELRDNYTLALEVIDTLASPERTGSIGIQITILDVNDNCPELDQSIFNIWANPALQVSPIATFHADDIDSGNNSVLRYYRSAIVATPPVSYNDSMDLHKFVYTLNTTLSFSVCVVDQGSPQRGATGTVTMVVDNSCLVSVEFEAIPYDFPMDEVTGDVKFIVPGYHHNQFECLRDLGVEKGFLLDQNITASSSKESGGPGRARLNMASLPANLGGLFGGWVAGVDDVNQWIQVESGEPYVFQVVQLQGRKDDVNYVTSFSILVSDDGVTFTKYTNSSGFDVFDGAFDQNTVVEVNLVPPARGKYLRINPRTWVGGIGLRFEMLGCTEREELHYEVSCERCETTWYCPGDGRMLPCGRCDPPLSNSTCGRPPTEHSFGLAEECTTCPLGWICKDGYAEPCEEFHYVSYCNDTYCPSACTPCEIGYACRGGQRYLCDTGTWSDGKKEFCELCRPGTYQDQQGQSSCEPCATGFRSTTMKDRCAPCDPKSWSKGDGSDCEACAGSAQCPCLSNKKLCFPGVTCRNAQNPDGSFTHVCDGCPPGYRGDGESCTDIDECAEHHPCWNESACKNTKPGYQCRACPIGYTGTFEDALAYNITRRNFEDCNTRHAASVEQTCDDVDECLDNNGGCDPNAYCLNTVGSFSCGLCKTGYIGNPLSGCELADYCVSGKHTCNVDATCQYAGPGDYSCKCNTGMAGNGFTCGPDPDMDSFPSVGISCNGEEFGNCKQDNCPDIPNSGQEDRDGDQMGDACDNDDDNDTVFDLQDNCPMDFNNKQEDADGDGVGDACDNCVNDVNPDQADADENGVGDACQVDSDGDGVPDTTDNCPTVANSDQKNDDGDNHGNACDNCPLTVNNNQDDVNKNGVGNACEQTDRDGDSIQDNQDNCPDLPNAAQTDTDGDTIGDYCDDDADDDGVPDISDNCPYVHNPGQDDVDGNHRGDLCELDYDMDGTLDRVDNCMEDKFINKTSFLEYTAVDFYRDWTGQPVAQWNVLDEGKEVRQVAITRRPVALIGNQALDHMDFYGTVYVEDDVCNGYVGVIFGYQSARKFYLATWRHQYSNFDDSGGMKGVQIRVIDSNVNVGSTLAYALYEGADVSSKTRVIWHESELSGWQCNVAYRWHIVHRPSLGMMSIEIKQQDTVVVSSGPVYDSTILGGKLGVFVFDQKLPIWSDLEYHCSPRLNYALQLDGVDDYAAIATLEDLDLDKSFTLEALIKLPSGYGSGKHPVLCTNGSHLCLYVENQVLNGQVDSTVITGSTTISGNTWTHVALRYNAQDRKLDLIVDGPKSTTEATLAGVQSQLVMDENTTLYIGCDGEKYLEGQVDEVRVYNIQHVELNEYTESVYLHQPWNKYLLAAHFNMEGATSTSTSLKDNGYKGLDAKLFGSPGIVESSSDQKVFDLTYN